MAMPFKDRYKRNKDILEWYDALAVAVAVIALVFTFGLRVVQVDGHSMQPTLLNGERLLMTPLKTPDYGDVVIVDSYIPYGKPLVKRVIGKAGIPSTSTSPPVSSTAMEKPWTSPTPPNLRIRMRGWISP